MLAQLSAADALKNRNPYTAFHKKLQEGSCLRVRLIYSNIIPYAIHVMSSFHPWKFVIALPVLAFFLSQVTEHVILNMLYPAFIDCSKNNTNVLIVGGGHAGLSAALTLVRHQHDVIVFDDKAPRDRWDSPMHVLPTWEYRNPSKLLASSRRELSKSGLVTFVDEKIVKVEKHNESLFHVTSSRGQQWSGRKLLIATGAEFDYPNIPGYNESFPEKMYVHFMKFSNRRLTLYRLHCMFTRGYEFRGSASAGIIAADLASSPPHAVILEEDTSKFAENVTIYTNGDENLASDIKKILRQKQEHNVPVDSRKIARIVREHNSDAIRIKFGHGDDRIENFIVHQPSTKVNRQLVYQLGLETNARGDIQTKMPFYQTNVSGVFAAGDAASPFKMIPNAIFQGSNAGAGVARELPRRLTGNKINRVRNGKLIEWAKMWR